MRTALKAFLFGLVLGSLVAFPLGMNFGRDEPILSNPFAKRDVNQRVKRTVKQKAESMVEGAKERLHDATKPVHEP